MFSANRINRSAARGGNESGPFQLVRSWRTIGFTVPSGSLCQLTVNCIDDELKRIFGGLALLLKPPAPVVIIRQPREWPVCYIIFVKYPPLPEFRVRIIGD